MTKTISSAQNPFIKNILLLKEKSKARKQQGLFIIEGLRELSLAIKGDYHMDTILFCPELIDLDKISKFTDNQSVDLISISKGVYQKIAYRSTTEGVIALVESKNFELKDLILSAKNPLILVAEAPEKPGNIGALLRTADAVKADAVIIANPLTDLFNPNIIRSSVGCIFTNNIATGTSLEIIQYLENKKINLYAAALHENSENYTLQNFKKSTAIVVGTESTGLSSYWLDASKKIIISMHGEIDSLNVSVSAAVILFEVIRQRSL